MGPAAADSAAESARRSVHGAAKHTQWEWQTVARPATEAVPDDRARRGRDDRARRRGRASQRWRSRRDQARAGRETKCGCIRARQRSRRKGQPARRGPARPGHGPRRSSRRVRHVADGVVTPPGYRCRDPVLRPRSRPTTGQLLWGNADAAYQGRTRESVMWVARPGQILRRGGDLSARPGAECGTVNGTGSASASLRLERTTNGRPFYQLLQELSRLTSKSRTLFYKKRT